LIFDNFETLVNLVSIDQPRQAHKNPKYFGLSFVKSLPCWSLKVETHRSKLSIYIFSFIKILGAKISNGYKPFIKHNGVFFFFNCCLHYWLVVFCLIVFTES